MGKPSSRNSERRLSNNSTHSMSHIAKMPPKNSKEWNRFVSKNQANIRKSITGLFDKLRETTKSLNNNKSNSSVIVLDDTIDSPNSNKRKSTLLNRTVKRKKSLNGTIVEINDEDLVTNNNPCTSSIQTPKKTLSPIHSSTPNDKNLKSDKLATKSDNKDVINLTEEIDDASYLTIDLTYNSDYNYNTANNTVIDLEKSADKSVPSGSHNNSSTSDDSNVTVLERSEFTKKNMRKYASHIGKLNASEKGRLLELLTDNIINGCKYNKQVIKKLSNYQDAANQSTETVEDAYIKDVIVGQSTSSHNSIGSNIYNPERDARNKVGLRMIVVDGSNVAMEHSKGKGFSVKGLKICIDYFLKRGHVVKAFVPRFRCKFGKSSDPRLLDHLERQGYVVYTPSREVQGKTITPYDDRYIVQCAAEFDAVIVSGDNYRDLMHENPKWKFVIENRLLQFTWVNDMLMFPRDPLGRNGPTLEEFLRHQPRNTASKHKDLKRVLNALQQGRLSLEEILRNLNAKPPQKPKRKKGYLKPKLRNNAMKTTATINSTTIQPTQATITTGCQTRVVNWQTSTYSSKFQSPSQAENQKNTFIINDEEFPPLGESSQKLIRQVENQPNDPPISTDRNEDRSNNLNSHTRTKLALNNAFRNICNKDARPQMEQLICEPKNHPSDPAISADRDEYRSNHLRTYNSTNLALNNAFRNICNKDAGPQMEQLICEPKNHSTDPAISADRDEYRSNHLRTYNSTNLALNNAFRSICNKGAKPQMEQSICQPANRPTEAANSASKEDNIPVTQTDPQPAFASSVPTSHQFKMPINKAKKDNRFDLIRKRLNKRQQKKKRAEMKRLKKTQARAAKVENQNSKKNNAVSHTKTSNVVKCSETISKFPATPDFIPVHRGNNILGTSDCFQHVYAKF